MKDDPLETGDFIGPAGAPAADLTESKSSPGDDRQVSVRTGSEPKSWQRRQVLIVCGLLALAVGLVFGQTVGHDFVNFDDTWYVYENPEVKDGLTAQGIAAAFSDHPYYHWQPLAPLSHMLDCQLYGLNAGGHHLTSVVLHAAAAISLFLVLLRMTGNLWPSAFVAAVFAVHPLRAESVAWVSERKDVLCALFFMLTLAAYVGYVRRRSWPRFLLVMALFGLGLMAKAMIVTLPLVLLLLDYWPLRRLEARGLRLEEAGKMSSGLRPLASSLTSQTFSLLAEKIPLALLAGAICVVTLVTQRTGIVANDQYRLGVRIGNALVSYVTYLGKLIYPVGLVPHYPHPGGSLPPWKVIVAAALLAAVTAGVVVWRKRCPYLLVGWLWYLVMLLPVSQVVQLGEYSMADRYTYLPQIGLCLAIAWGAAAIGRSWPHRRWLLGTLGLLVVGALMGCAWRQVSYWRDSQTLWSHALAVNPRIPLAHNNLAGILTRREQIEEAMRHYEMALELDPNYAVAHFNLAAALAKQEKTDAAIAHYQKALEIDPKYLATYNNLGALLIAQGKPEEAIALHRKALELDPESSSTHNNLGSTLSDLGQIDEAIGHYRKALEIDPDYAAAHYNLANALSRQGKTAEAITHYRAALKIRPAYAEAHCNLANLVAEDGHADEAIMHYKKALAIRPKYVLADVNLAAVLARSGKVSEAVARYEKIVAAHPDRPDAHFNLGMIWHDQRKTRDAVGQWREAVRLQPNHLGYVYRLAWTLATSPDDSVRNGEQALELADRAVRLSGGRVPTLLDALAAAYAETGEFPRAIQIAAKGLTAAETQHNGALADGLRNRLRLYRSGSPYRESP